MLNTLLKQRPNQTIAFLPNADADVLAETLVAFANADGGMVVMGVGLDGRPNGSLTPDDAENALRQALPQCRPPVVIDWQQEEVAGGWVVTIRVPRSVELHALVDGRVLVRHRTENQPLGGEAIRQLAATKSTGDFEVSAVPGTSLLEFDRHILDEYLQQRARRGRKPPPGGIEDHLIEIGAMTPDGEATVVGLLLFGKHPQTFLPDRKSVV